MLNKNFFSIAASLLILAGCGGCKKTVTNTNENAHHTHTGFTKAVNDTVFFSFDSSELSHQARSDLEKQADWIKSNSTKEHKFIVEGHCDKRGTRSYNLALGERRADAAKKYLTAQGLDSSALSTVSYGSERPLVEGDNEQAWSKNRRAVTVEGHHHSH